MKLLNNFEAYDCALSKYRTIKILQLYSQSWGNTLTLSQSTMFNSLLWSGPDGIVNIMPWPGQNMTKMTQPSFNPDKDPVWFVWYNKVAIHQVFYHIKMLYINNIPWYVFHLTFTIFDDHIFNLVSCVTSEILKPLIAPYIYLSESTIKTMN